MLSNGLAPSGANHSLTRDRPLVKINFIKILKILSQLVVAAPTIVAAIKPIVREVKGRGETSPTIGPSAPATKIGGSPPAARYRPTR